MFPWATSDLSAPSCSSSKGPKAGSALAQGPHSRGEERQGTVCNSQRETDRPLFAQQRERRRAPRLHCPSASRKSEQTWPREGQHGVSDHGPTTSWGTPQHTAWPPWALVSGSQQRGHTFCASPCYYEITCAHGGRIILSHLKLL